jgi:uncharacterized tellurite resistance protein B-like protein
MNFTESQKETILRCLLEVANVDREFHEEEKIFLQDVARQMDYPLTDERIVDIMTIEINKVFELMGSLGMNQKDWFVVTLFGMIHADGTDLDTEYQMMEVYFDMIGFSRARYEEVIVKTGLVG